MIFIKCIHFQNAISQILKRSISVPFQQYQTITTAVIGERWKLSQKQVYFATQSFHTSKVIFKRRKTSEERKFPKQIEYSPKSKGGVVDIWRGITLKELAQVLEKDVVFVKELFLNQYKDPNTSIVDVKELQLAVRRSGQRIRLAANPNKTVYTKEVKDAYPRPPAPKSELKPRPPVVTVMGHVDHGKTTLLDALRHSSVVEQEFGGITQHIGAFSVVLESGARITFLDTPGHAAFTAMRERGANITDIVVLVVAADDGVMEQTVESIRMARQANVPILVAINKTDAPNADVERTEFMLSQVGIQVEKLGGDVQAIPISALKKRNLEQLIEALTLQAELLEVGGDPTGPVEAVVVDSRVDQGRGRLCTVVVQRGTLKKGAILVAGTALGKVRNLRDAEGKFLTAVGPGYPAEIEGWRELPPAGEIILEIDSEKRAREVIKIREEKNEEEKLSKDAEAIRVKEEQHIREYKDKLTLKRKLGRFRLKPEGPRKPEIPDDDSGPFLNLVIKADVDGTLEAVLDTLDTYDESDLCKMDLIHYGVGPVTENDVQLANIFKGVVYCFNVDCPDKIKKLANEAEVTVKHHNVIYKLVDDVKGELNVRLPQKEVEEEVGEASVIQQFEINEGRKKVPIAGCRCKKGSLKRAALYRLIRVEEIVHEGSLISMRHLKNEVDVIKNDTECGLQFADKTVTFKPGDKIICFEKKLVAQTTNWDPGF